MSELQWGHAFVSVETHAIARVQQVRMPVLQWGHAFVSVETWAALLSLCSAATGFNGATLL